MHSAKKATLSVDETHPELVLLLMDLHLELERQGLKKSTVQALGLYIAFDPNRKLNPNLEYFLSCKRHIKQPRTEQEYIVFNTMRYFNLVAKTMVFPAENAHSLKEISAKKKMAIQRKLVELAELKRSDELLTTLSSKYIRHAKPA